MWWSWQRPKRDKEALGKALAEAIAEGTADVPLRVRFGWGGAVGYAGRVSFFAAMLIAWHILFGLDFGVAIILITAAHLLFGLATSIPDFTNLNRAINVSGEGVRLDKFHRSYTIPWWDVQQIKATPDLRLIRVLGRFSRITISTSELSPEVAPRIVHALRTRARDYGLDISEWPLSDRIAQQAVSGASAAVGTSLLMAALVFFTPGRTLGMRCSANSAFLQEAFGTPQRLGCVVLRVSAGAQKAGIHVGDLVIEMEGVPVTSGRQFDRVFEESSQPWEFTVIRQGEPRPLEFAVKGGRGKRFKEDKDDPFFYYLRARWDAGDKPQKAIQDYSRVIELEPRFDLAYVYRARLYEDRGDTDLARRDYEKALELAPGLAEAHSSYAYFLNPGDREGARQHIEQAIELDHCPGAFERYKADCATYYLLLFSLEATADIILMAEAADQSIRFYPGFADSYYQAACAYATLHDRVRSVDNARRYLEFPAEEREQVRSEHMREILERDGASCR